MTMWAMQWTVRKLASTCCCTTGRGHTPGANCQKGEYHPACSLHVMNYCLLAGLWWVQDLCASGCTYKARVSGQCSIRRVGIPGCLMGCTTVHGCGQQLNLRACWSLLSCCCCCCLAEYAGSHTPEYRWCATGRKWRQQSLPWQQWRQYNAGTPEPTGHAVLVALRCCACLILRRFLLDAEATAALF